ncbi:unnamed protein product, partial [marine sediment metagenome]
MVGFGIGVKTDFSLSNAQFLYLSRAFENLQTGID